MSGHPSLHIAPFKGSHTSPFKCWLLKLSKESHGKLAIHTKTNQLPLPPKNYRKAKF